MRYIAWGLEVGADGRRHLQASWWTDSLDLELEELLQRS